MSDFFALFQANFLLHNALVSSVAVGFFCPLVGIYFYLRRAVLLGVALPQISSAGASFAFFLQGMGITWLWQHGEHVDRPLALTGSILLTLVAIYGLAYLERKGEGTTESRLGAVYALAFALSILFVTQNANARTEFLSLLQGEIVAVSESDLHHLIWSYGILGAVLLILNPQFLLVSFDRESARVMGKNILVWDGLLYTLLGISISMSVLIVGPMLTFAFLIIPPLAVRRFCSNMKQFFWASSLLGGVSGFFGFYVSYHWDWPLAPSQIVVASVFLAVAVVIKKIKT